MGFVYGAGSKTLPKAGKLGSGAFYKGGHNPAFQGNVFGANWDKPAPGQPQVGGGTFGASQALLSTTQVGRQPNAITQQFPLDTHYQRATYHKLQPMTHARAGAVGVTKLTTAVSIQPQEMTTFVHGRVNVKRATFRATGGVNNTLPHSTAFQDRPKRVTPKANPAPTPDISKRGGMNFQHGARTLPGGLPSVNQGHPVLIGNASARNVSFDRWSQVKRGAAG